MQDLKESEIETVVESLDIESLFSQLNKEERERITRLYKVNKFRNKKGISTKLYWSECW